MYYSKKYKNLISDMLHSICGSPFEDWRMVTKRPSLLGQLRLRQRTLGSIILLEIH